MAFTKWLNRLLALGCLGCVSLVAAQETMLSGAVRDQNTHREIRGVNIFVKDTKVGTSSDFAGRYSLRVAETTLQTTIVFRHIAYEAREISLDSLRVMKVVYLQPRVITLPSVEVEAENVVRMEIAKDLPQPTAVIDAKSFEIRGYVDAGDLLKTDQSVQVEEELSGKKTVAIRGGNADEVVVLYNGVKMNSAYDNIFDLSLIDLEDIERFEIIKGSNTALYGPEAFSGVINIVPKVQQDYTLRVNQRVGTYRSGNWGVHLYQKFQGLNGSYSFKRGGTKRNIIGAATDNNELENLSLHHTANLLYSFSEHPDGRPANSLGAMYVYTSLEYDNQRDVESLSNFNQLFSLKYTGNARRLLSLDLSASLRRLKEDQFLASSTGALTRGFEDRELQINAEKRFYLNRLDLLFGYQMQRAELDFNDVRRNFDEQLVGLESADLERQHHGLVAIAKLHSEPESEFLQTVDVDVSVRHDRVRDAQSNAVVRGTSTTLPDDAGVFADNEWNETMFKFAVSLSGYRDNLAMNAFLNFGTNVKFPTLFQQISVPEFLCLAATSPNLNPERNNSLELGFTLSRDIRGHRSIYGWQLSGNFFQNHYDNKFLTLVTPGIPVVFYENAATARLSGFESKGSVFFFRKKITIEAGVSRFFISDLATFPFKSEMKRTLNFIVDHAGYAFQAHLFKEGEQIGRLHLFKFEHQGTPLQCEFSDIILPTFSNLDLHLSKSFTISKLKLFANASGRNLLNNSDVVLEGIAIRDRRYYLTIGAQY